MKRKHECDKLFFCKHSKNESVFKNGKRRKWGCNELLFGAYRLCGRHCSILPTDTIPNGTSLTQNTRATLTKCFTYVCAVLHNVLLESVIITFYCFERKLDQAEICLLGKCWGTMHRELNDSKCCPARSFVILSEFSE